MVVGFRSHSFVVKHIQLSNLDPHPGTGLPTLSVNLTCRLDSTRLDSTRLDSTCLDSTRPVATRLGSRRSCTVLLFLSLLASRRPSVRCLFAPLLCPSVFRPRPPLLPCSPSSLRPSVCCVASGGCAWSGWVRWGPGGPFPVVCVFGLGCFRSVPGVCSGVWVFDLTVSSGATVVRNVIEPAPQGD